MLEAATPFGADSGMIPPSSRHELWPAMRSGFLGRCPRCHSGRIFASYLKVADLCPYCCLELHHHRADDAPPYFTIFLVGHLVVPWIWLVERAYRPSIWMHVVLWLPLVVVLSLLLLPSIKGAIVGMQWAMRMHGFALAPERRQEDPPLSEVSLDDAARRPQ
jgi:uncharacterized protein (DUF983 family)